MKVAHLPPEIELSFPFRALRDRVGAHLASHLFLRLWCDLAFQARLHGETGVYRAQDLPLFCRSVDRADADKLLKECGLVKERENGDLWCPIFYEHNAHLDKSWVPPTSKWLSDWIEFQRRLEASADLAMTSKLPKEAWYLPGGEVVPEGIMNRAMVIIQSIDVILRTRKRDYSTVSVALAQGAAGVALRHSPTKISVVLKRFLAMSRPQLNPMLPPTTEQAVLHFDDLIMLVCPDEGFGSWLKRIETEPNHQNEEEAVSDSIARELSEKLSGIPA